MTWERAVDAAESPQWIGGSQTLLPLGGGAGLRQGLEFASTPEIPRVHTTPNGPGTRWGRPGARCRHQVEPCGQPDAAGNERRSGREARGLGYPAIDSASLIASERPHETARVVVVDS